MAPTAYSGWSNALCGEGKCASSQRGCQIFGCCCAFLTLLFIIILPLSVVHVPVDEYALPKRRSTSVVQTDKNALWTNGPHWVGPDYTTQSVPSRLEIEEIEMAPFVKGSGQELPVSIRLFWRQDPDAIPTNFIRFGDHTAVRTRLLTSLDVAIKGRSVKFLMTEYYMNLNLVRDGFVDAIKEQLETIKLGIQIHGLFFTSVVLPYQMISSSLQSAILTESEVIKRIERTASLTREATKTMRRQIEANTQLIDLQAKAESEAIVKSAVAEGAALAAGAEGRGLANFFKALNITTLQSKAAYQRYLAILRKKKGN